MPLHSARATKALEKSIAHWEENYECKTPMAVKIGPENCALCHKYNNVGSCNSKCPIRNKTGKNFCVDTPYKDTVEKLTLWAYGNDKQTKAAYRRACKKFIRYMEKLL